MIHRNSILCKTCGTETTIRTAIGHGSYQEFAFPCPQCAVEIRFGMQIDHKNVKFEFTKLINGEWGTGGPGKPEYSVESTVVLDAENLIPIAGEHFSPFLSTVFLARDTEKFHRHQVLRLHACQTIWPMIEKLIIHETNRNEVLYDRQKNELGYNKECLTWGKRTLQTLYILDKYSTFFSVTGRGENELMRQRINLAEVASPELIRGLLNYLNATGKSNGIFVEIFDIRKRWSHLYPMFSPIFNIFYWDEESHSLDDYTLAQKRFEELKTLYVDCFETLCRISVIAAAIEGIIWIKRLEIPTSKKAVKLEDFDRMPNGSKPDLLKKLIIGNVFVLHIDNRLRNGIGHHSARYDVNTDQITYSYNSKKGIRQTTIPYIRFCEKVVRLYIQIELTSVYAHWARAKAEGIIGKIV